MIVLSAHKQIHDVTDALNAGAVGYVLKADPPETLMHALEHVARGESYVAPALAITLAREAKEATPDILELLSEREREVFRLAADCRTSPEIARALCLARKTVDTHLNRINRKLGLRDRAELGEVRRQHRPRAFAPAPRLPIPALSDDVGVPSFLARRPIARADPLRAPARVASSSAVAHVD